MLTHRPSDESAGGASVSESSSETQRDVTNLRCSSRKSTARKTSDSGRLVRSSSMPRSPQYPTRCMRFIGNVYIRLMVDPCRFVRWIRIWTKTVVRFCYERPHCFVCPPEAINKNKVHRVFKNTFCYYILLWTKIR